MPMVLLDCDKDIPERRKAHIYLKAPGEEHQAISCRLSNVVDDSGRACPNGAARSAAPSW
jgi:hypothetical protein